MVWLLAVIPCIIVISTGVGIYLSETPIGKKFFRYKHGISIHSGGYRLKFGTERSRMVYILMGFFPLVYVILRISTFEPTRLPSRKKRLRMANTLLQCVECDKYSRGYQSALISEYEGTCVHCNGEVNIKDTRTDDKAKLELIRFLETHPECPKISYKELKLMIDYWEAKQYNNGVGKVNEEIERVMKSYEETGNQYMQQLYRRGKE